MKKTQNSTDQVFRADRREFLRSGLLAASGLMLGTQFSCTDAGRFLTGDPSAVFNPNIWIDINGLGEVTIVTHRSEMGTGIRSTLPMVMADELEADWSQVRLEQAVGDEKYGDQNTDGSYSVRMFYEPLRKVAATVRLMLERTAAAEWQVDPSECKAQNHKVVHTSGKSFGFGYLAERAVDQPVPDESEVTLKSPEDFNYITKKTSIYDLEDIVTGKAKFGLDHDWPNAKIAMVVRNPEAGAGITNLDDSAAKDITGVREIFQMKPSGFPTNYDRAVGGVAIVAENTWAAIKAREALKVDWSPGMNADYDSARYTDRMARNVRRNGQVRREEGNIHAALRRADKVIRNSYQVPHYAHAPMEPPCAVVDVQGESCRVWAPVQDPQWTRRAVAQALEIDPANVTVQVSLLGGAFGRKSKPDFVVEAALISKQHGTPIKLMWTREDDLQHDFYHFACAQHLEVGLSNDGEVQAWLHRSSFPPIAGTAVADARQPATFEISMGLIDMPYRINHVCCETLEAPAKIRIGWLRSVANINHAFAVGCTLDEVAEARGLDPIANIIDLLGEDRQIDFPALSSEYWNYNEPLDKFPWDTGRFRRVIETARDRSGWGKALPAGSGMGFAAHRSFLTYVACVVEVQVDDGGQIQIPMVHYAVDCGVPVNPERIKAQFEGGAAFATSMALKGHISVLDGAVQQSNFDDYELARITDAPYDTEVHIVESTEKPTGVGEPPVPPYIPALCNAIYQATGKRIRQLPIRLDSGDAI